jgi:hypothetical protein
VPATLAVALILTLAGVFLSRPVSRSRNHIFSPGHPSPSQFASMSKSANDLAFEVETTMGDSWLPRIYRERYFKDAHAGSTSSLPCPSARIRAFITHFSN